MIVITNLTKESEATMYKCPKCGCDDYRVSSVECEYEFTDTEILPRTLSDEEPMVCEACGYYGKVAEFLMQEGTNG